MRAEGILFRRERRSEVARVTLAPKGYIWQGGEPAKSGRKRQMLALSHFGGGVKTNDDRIMSFFDVLGLLTRSMRSLDSALLVCWLARRRNGTDKAQTSVPIYAQTGWSMTNTTSLWLRWFQVCAGNPAFQDQIWL